MSIFSTVIDFDSHRHDPQCAMWVDAAETDQWTLIAGGRKYRLDETRSCSCRCGPIRYQGSHVLPSDDDERGGSFSLCLIPGFITRLGRPPLTDEDDDHPAHPWMRVWVRSEGEDAGQAVVLLDRTQIAEVHQFLGAWLGHSEAAGD